MKRIKNEINNKNITIIDLENKKAKFQDFEDGINDVTTKDKIDANWFGKSSLLRSIYHTLGVDCKFSDYWDNEKKFIYFVEFIFKNKLYTIMRNKKIFSLFNQNFERKFKVWKKEDLAKELIKYFNQEIYLKTNSGSFSLAFPGTIIC